MLLQDRGCFWFDGRAEEAAALDVSLLPGAELGTVHRSESEGPATLVDISRADIAYQALCR